MSKKISEAQRTFFLKINDNIFRQTNYSLNNNFSRELFLDEFEFKKFEKTRIIDQASLSTTKHVAIIECNNELFFITIGLNSYHNYDCNLKITNEHEAFFLTSMLSLPIHINNSMDLYNILSYCELNANDFNEKIRYRYCDIKDYFDSFFVYKIYINEIWTSNDIIWRCLALVLLDTEESFFYNYPKSHTPGKAGGLR